MKLTIVMYHYVRDLKHNRYQGIKGLDCFAFSKQIEWLASRYQIVTMEQVLASVRENILLPENALILTFDDGYIDHYTNVLPVLEKNNIQGSFFIPAKIVVEHELLDVNKIHYILACADERQLLKNLFEMMDYYRCKELYYDSNDILYNAYASESRFDNKDIIFIKRMLQNVLPENVRKEITSELFKKHVDISEEKLAYELYLTIDQIRTMKRHGMYIGIHGFDHHWLGNIPKQKMQKDLDMALDAMNEFIDSSNWVMCYPYGNYNNDVLEYVHKRGASIGLATEVNVADMDDNLLTLPRLDCNDFPPQSDHYIGYHR